MGGTLRSLGLAGAATSRGSAIDNLSKIVGKSGAQALFDAGRKSKALGPVSRVIGVNDAGRRGAVM